MNFAALDLNLLRVFDAMTIELNTTRAGERVGLSQPAVSSALGRLRHIVGDELFVREGNRMVPTRARADAARADPRGAAPDGRCACRRSPASIRRRPTQTFRISGSDYFSTLLMPRLAAAVMPEAPGVTLQMLDHPSSEALRLLGEGAIDMAVVPSKASGRPLSMRARSAGLGVQPQLFQSFIVSVAPKHHPMLDKAGIKPGHRIPARRLLRHPAGADVDGRRQDRHRRPGACRARPAAPGGAHRAALPGGRAGDRGGRPARQPADPLRAPGRAGCSTSISICRPTIRRSPT